VYKRQGQLGFEASLGVDQLDRPNHLVVVVPHGHGEHRLRPVAVLGIESLSALRLAGRRIVCVVVDLACPHRDRVADHALLVHRHLEVLVGALVYRGVLACAQRELGLIVLTYRLPPQAGAIGVGELAHRREDEFLELADVPLGGQSDPYAIELLELTVLPLRLILELTD